MLGLVRSFNRLSVAATRNSGFVSQIHSSAITLKAKKAESAEPVPPKADQTASSVFNISEDISTEEGLAEYTTIKLGKGQVGQVRIREYEYSTANFHVSPRKLRMIGNQITGLSVTEAIRQMQFSAKKASDKIKHSLVWARKNAIFQKQMNPDNMYIKLVRVGKGQFRKRLDPKARGRFGVIRVPYAHMKYTFYEKHPEDLNMPTPTNPMEKALLVNGQLPRRKIKGFKLSKNVWTPLNERKPIYNPKPFYNW